MSGGENRSNSHLAGRHGRCAQRSIISLRNGREVIGELRDDYVEVLREEGNAASFPEALISRLPSETYSLLLSGWGQPNHERVLEKHTWVEVVELANQVKRQSDRIVEWYSAVLDPAIPAALGQIQEYLLSVVENMPRSGRRDWFLEDKANEAFLAEYRKLWLSADPTLEAEREKARGIQFAIADGIQEGTKELQAQEEDRAYVDPTLVSLYAALNPSGCVRSTTSN
ncbi:MAG TPA: hypothetical protein VN892_11735 [Solirubrobacteraceae bacterium]|nr:hypothetical protein [Solirubrobacteraceae bacterium]